MMKYGAFMFDLDGTLVHSLPEHRYTVVGGALKELGANGNEKDIDRFWFESNRDKTIRDCFGLYPDVFWPVYKKHDKADVRAKFTKPYDDIGFIKEIKKCGVKTGILTGAPPHILEMELGMLGGINFDAIIMARNTNGVKEKPDPQGLEECLNLLGVSKDKAIYIGNGDEDVKAAQNAGVFDVLIDRKEHTFPGLSPSLTIYSLYELRMFLEG